MDEKEGIISNFTSYAEYYKWSDLNVNENDRVGFFVQLSNVGDGTMEIATSNTIVFGVVVNDASVIGNHNPFSSQNRFKITNLGKKLKKITFLFPLITLVKSYKSTLSHNVYTNVIYIPYNLGARRGHSSDNETILTQFKVNLQAYRDANVGSISASDDSEMDNLVFDIDNNFVTLDDYDFLDTTPPIADVTKYDIVGLFGCVAVIDDETCVVGEYCDCSNAGIATAGSRWLVIKRSNVNVIEIMFSSTTGGQSISLVSVGSGDSLINDGVGPDVTVKSFIAGDHMQITDNTTSLTLNANLYPSTNFIFVVSKSGLLGTFTTVKAAVIAANAIGTKARIRIEPGTYVEDNPINLNSDVSIVSEDTARTVYVQAANANLTIFNLGIRSELLGIRIEGANLTGGIGVAFDGTGIPGLSYLTSCTITDCDIGLWLSGTPGIIVVQECIITSDPVHMTQLTTGIVITGECDARIMQTGVNGIRVPPSIDLSVQNGVIVNQSAKMTATHLSIFGCVKGLTLDGSEDVMYKSSIIKNCDIGLNVIGDTTLFQSGCNYLSNIDNDICIAANSVTEITIAATQLDRTKIHNPNNVNLKFSGFSNDPSDPSYLIMAELHVGDPDHPKECALGEGDSYTNEMIIMTNTNLEVGTWTDKTLAAQSKDDSQFDVFEGTTIDQCLYIGAPRQFPGFKSQMVTKIVGESAVRLEYWNGSSWVMLRCFVSDGDSPYYPNADHNFDSQSTITPLSIISVESRFGRMPDWTIKTLLNGTSNYYWVRFVIDSVGMTTIPQLEQIQLHPNSVKVNGDGFITYFGSSRRMKPIGWDIGLVEAASNSPANQDMYLSDGIGVGRQENRFQSNAVDSVGNCLAVPFDFDTSLPVCLSWYWTASSLDNVVWRVRTGHCSIGDAIYTSQATAPTTHPTENVIEIIENVSSTDTLLSTVVELYFSKVIAHYEDGTPGDLIWFSIERDGGDLNDTNNGDVSIVNLYANYHSWATGGYMMK